MTGSDQQFGNFQGSEVRTREPSHFSLGIWTPLFLTRHWQSFSCSALSVRLPFAQSEGFTREPQPLLRFSRHTDQFLTSSGKAPYLEAYLKSEQVEVKRKKKKKSQISKQTMQLPVLTEDRWKKGSSINYFRIDFLEFIQKGFSLPLPSWFTAALPSTWLPEAAILNTPSPRLHH